MTSPTPPADTEDRRVPNGGSRPVPDPTVLTDRAIDRAMVSERDYVDGQLAIRDERLKGIDTATALRLGSVEQIPEAIRREVGHLEAVIAVKFEGVSTQLKERDARAVREAQLGKDALDAAFSASKEAVAKQDEGNQKAIDKSERATADKIDKLAELFNTSVMALGDKIEDVKMRVSEVATVANGTVQRGTGAKDDRTGLYASIAIIGTILGIIVSAIIIIALIVGAKAGV